MSIIDRLNEQSTGLETYHNRVSNIMNNFDLEKGIFDQTQEAKKADEKSSLQAIAQKQLDSGGLIAPLAGSVLKTGSKVVTNKLKTSGITDAVGKKLDDVKSSISNKIGDITDSIKDKYNNLTSKNTPSDDSSGTTAAPPPQQNNEAFNPDSTEPVAQRGGQAASRPNEGSVPGEGDVTGGEFSRVTNAPASRQDTGGGLRPDEDRPAPAQAAPAEGEPAAATAERVAGEGGEAATEMGGIEKEVEGAAEGEGGGAGLIGAAIGAASTLAGKGSAGQKAGALGKLGAEGAGIEAASAFLPGAGEILAGAVGIGSLIYDHRQKQKEEASDAASAAAGAASAPRAPQMGGVAFNAAPVLDSSDFHSL